MGIKKIESIIKLYSKELKKKINPEKIILFGSYAKGKATKESDIDLVVISKDFKGLSPDQRYSVLTKARLTPKMRLFAMDIFGYTPKEYRQASPLTTLGEIKETGITIFSS